MRNSTARYAGGARPAPGAGRRRFAMALCADALPSAHPDRPSRDHAHDFGEERLSACFEAADLIGVPRLLEPADVASGATDQLSMMGTSGGSAALVGAAASLRSQQREAAMAPARLVRRASERAAAAAGRGRNHRGRQRRQGCGRCTRLRQRVLAWCRDRTRGYPGVDLGFEAAAAAAAAVAAVSVAAVAVRCGVGRGARVGPVRAAACPLPRED